MKKTANLAVLLLTLVLVSALAGCQTPAQDDAQADTIQLADGNTTFNGAALTEDTSAPVHISHDIIYYENKEKYESGNPYGEGTEADRHTAEEAAAHTVINITQPGTYRLTGQLEKGQVRVDLGEDAFTDPEAAVTLVLDGADITCEVAPAILFRSVYECDNGWSAETAKSDVDTAAAGANIIIADGSENNINGSHVAKIFKDNTEEKKLWKQDGALYSYMSMNVGSGEAGTGILNLNADNEGLDTELHLTINGGNINIFSDNDGINTNEDGVSVTTINGGNIHIMAGLGAEGDGIDSNGWLVINGGTVIASANPGADAGLDSDMGSYVNGGTVVALGSTMDWAESDSEQITMNLQFASYKDSGDDITVKNAEDDSVIFTFDPASDPVLAGNARNYMGAVISSPDFELNATYHVYVGGTQQSYTGTDVRMRPGGMGGFGGGGGFRGDFDPENLPEDFDPSQIPQDGQRPEGFGGRGQKPEDFDPENLPEGMELPEGFDPTQLPQDGQRPQKPEDQLVNDGTIRETGQAQSDFYMQDKVNAFSGVTDAAEA
ncbi:MAG: carbohydrate-binding domain-containing protein [Firmicutes bacterium]|nr:carbohydrate-binding domain-containing protein [Bacillota bacterium]